VLHRLTDLGNTVVIIEHNLDIIRNADYVLDMGPEGGEGGGRIIAHGTPEQIATVASSHTGSFLSRYYASHSPAFTSRNGTSHAGPQPHTIAAAPDAVKRPKSRFIAPEKKTGLAKAGSAKPEERTKPKAKKKSTISKTANKITAKIAPKL
jgi:excinuclease ABC subunit A